MERIKFIKKPKIRDKVKVYITHFHSYYGIVQRLKYIEQNETLRQIVVLKKTKPIDLWDIDFFLDPSKVQFIK